MIHSQAAKRSVHPAELDPQRLLPQCAVRRGRRSGPGGQHRNKVETAIVLTHLPTGVRAEATERRSQQQNLEVALFRLRVNLALQVRCPLADPPVASQAWLARCAGGRISLSPRHEQFPTLLAEALDVLEACDMDAPAAAATLQVTLSQLTKLLKAEPRALSLVNVRRRERGQRALL